MCIGGSETAELDRFKRKLDPIRTQKLRTIRLSLLEKGNELISNAYVHPPGVGFSNGSAEQYVIVSTPSCSNGASYGHWRQQKT